MTVTRWVAATFALYAASVSVGWLAGAVHLIPMLFVAVSVILVAYTVVSLRGGSEAGDYKCRCGVLWSKHSDRLKASPTHRRAGGVLDPGGEEIDALDLAIWKAEHEALELPAEEFRRRHGRGCIGCGWSQVRYKNGRRDWVIQDNRPKEQLGPTHLPALPDSNGMCGICGNALDLSGEHRFGSITYHHQDGWVSS